MSEPIIYAALVTALVAGIVLGYYHGAQQPMSEPIIYAVLVAALVACIVLIMLPIDGGKL